MMSFPVQIIKESPPRDSGGDSFYIMPLQRNVYYENIITLWTILLFISADPAVGQTLISKGSVWKYLDDGSDQGADWKETRFNDSAWKSGVRR